jgi:protein-disulfide isomerase
MHKTILTILSTALIAGAAVQLAAAAERHHTKTAARVPAPASDQFRNSNAAWNAAWPAKQEQPYWSRYSGGYSAPAGR